MTKLTLEKVRKAYELAAEANKHKCKFEEIPNSYICRVCGLSFNKERAKWMVRAGQVPDSVTRID